MSDWISDIFSGVGNLFGGGASAAGGGGGIAWAPGFTAAGGQMAPNTGELAAGSQSLEPGGIMWAPGFTAAGGQMAPGTGELAAGSTGFGGGDSSSGGGLGSALSAIGSAASKLKLPQQDDSGGVTAQVGAPARTGGGQGGAQRLSQLVSQLQQNRNQYFQSAVPNQKASPVMSMYNPAASSGAGTRGLLGL